jgi:hypothetical protein
MHGIIGMGPSDVKPYFAGATRLAARYVSLAPQGEERRISQPGPVLASSVLLSIQLASKCMIMMTEKHAACCGFIWQQSSRRTV